MSGGSSIPKPYKPTGQASADQGYQALTSSLAPWATQIPSYVLPQLQTATNAQVNNPYASGAQSGANATGAYATGTLAPMNYGAASTLYGNASAITPYAQQALATANDPQNALYNRSYQQVMDQQNAINAQNGIAGTPYGAGVAGQTGANFNLDWLNNQQNRQATGANIYDALTGTQNNLYAGASNIGNAGVQAALYGAMLPYSTYGSIAANQANALNNYSSGASNAFAPASALAGLYGNYLGIGQNATGLGIQGAQAQNAQDASMWGGIGNILGYGAGLFGF
jgi:hypothetical protein